MASACVNNVGVTPGNKFSSYSWLTPPRVSFDAKSSKPEAAPILEEREKSDLENDASDFEFCLHYPVDILPAADQLISDGKLMPMLPVSTANKLPVVAEPETAKTRRITEVMSSSGSGGGGGGDPSPKGPRCASRWKGILGLKKLHQNSININNTIREKSSRSLMNLLNRTSKSSSDSATDLPLLRDPDCESVSMSSRLSLSSSSSGHELDDFPRLSLDAEKPSINPISLLKNNPNPPPRLRHVKSRPAETTGSRPMRRTVSTDQTSLVDSPRMNSSGKIVFQSLERSSSSPGSFNGGPRLKHGGGGMERSYSAHVRASTVLNVPVCSLSKSGSVFGFGQLFSSQQKRDSNGRSYQCISNSSSSSNGRNRAGADRA